MTTSPLSERAKYLVCVSDNAHSRVALRFAATMAKKHGAPVELLHIIEPVDPMFRGLAETMREERRSAAEQLLTRYCEEMQSWNGLCPTALIREGTIVETIIKCVEEDHTINLLVVGAAYDSPSRDVLVPNLSMHLGDRLLIPLLVVPGTLTEQQIRELA